MVLFNDTQTWQGAFSLLHVQFVLTDGAPSCRGLPFEPLRRRPAANSELSGGSFDSFLYILDFLGRALLWKGCMVSEEFLSGGCLADIDLGCVG